ncbi:DUF2187 family protein [Lacticaseibacillus saniviri]|uniref:DUF2187 domain-containing protein n=1 Tax=Lacticaseibacillus saniviri JCM 17471 = DSM 24301 TaxID=1293598 RepID=A0A0R2MU12_9LACO|nr:DUF2187 family protein [Lacticaseibacillus saniviri]KRO17009.1 hypothetical protein IV56_GL000698 [Lacticaseibacillus saniviri JCM 17471 = DSM 24301]MCG4282399.1 YkvS family protein [Lacticaseibacillus saniviri]
MAVEIAVGDKVSVKKNGDVPLSFKGTVEKFYANSALLSIDEFDDADAQLVDDLKQKTVINYKNIRKGGKNVEPPQLEEGK